MLEHHPCPGGALCGGCRLSAAQFSQRLGNARIEACVRVPPATIVKRILLAELVHLRSAQIRKQLSKYRTELAADIAAQKFKADRRATERCQHVTLRAADVRRRIEQRAVDIEQVNRITRNHRTGLSLPSMARRMILTGGKPCARNLSWKSSSVKLAPRSR